MLQLYFSSDGGNTFDNKDSPRVAIPDASGDDESRRILHEQARRRLCEKPECSKECQITQKGRECCESRGITNEQCSLNGQGNTCTCTADGGRECYIEMRCNKEYLTWQDEKCKYKPDRVCFGEYSLFMPKKMRTVYLHRCYKDMPKKGGFC